MEMGRYCKAYEAHQLKQYPGWDPDLSQLRPPEGDGAGEEGESRTGIEDDDILYLHEDLVVTDDVYRDEYVLFQDPSEEWRRFCRETLEFEVPEDVLAIGAEPEPEAAGTAGAEEAPGEG